MGGSRIFARSEALVMARRARLGIALVSDFVTLGNERAGSIVPVADACQLFAWRGCSWSGGVY